jgi:hypothetical protein
MSVLRRLGLSFAVAAAAAIPLAAQQPAVTVDGDDITITGCIGKVDTQVPAPPAMLVWSRSDIMLAGVKAGGEGAPNPVGTSGVSGRVFYWLDDDEDLSKHVGQRVEIKGELEDFEKGEIEIKQDGEFTEITLDLDGKEEKARVPTSWLQDAGADKEQSYEIAARRFDVEDIRVLGACDER